VQSGTAAVPPQCHNGELWVVTSFKHVEHYASQVDANGRHLGFER